jgi:hypothetical protein
MKTRSALEICLPLTLFIGARALSFPTLLIAVVWMTIGVISVGHRTLETFPADGIRREWLRGYRGACLLFYHLAWWPWYMRTPLRDNADRIRGHLFAGTKSPHHKPENPPDKLSDGESEDANAGDAHSGKRD